ncbi:MAG: hypothetical protein FJY92_11295 [Candidatus Hydrogenedentes bacterium]|nr:hypothetical protein [Candidatus Hydrogenedentota bacterium]
MTTAKPGAYLQAFLRVSSEQRRCMKLYGLDGPALAPDSAVSEQDRRARCDTSLLPEDVAELDPHGAPAGRRAGALLNEAEFFASKGNHSRAKERFRRAEFLSRDLAAQAREPTSEWFLPAIERMFAGMKAGNGKRVDDS